MNRNKAVLKNDVLLKKNDYEKYQLVLPYRFLFGSRKQRFIYTELEKIHPCFSDEFCFDSNIKGLSKKGALSDVVVIHKYTLAEYEAKRPASGSLINKTSGTGFFAETDNHHRFFVDGKMKNLSVIGLTVISLVVLFFAAGCVSKFMQPVVSAEPVIEEVNDQSVSLETETPLEVASLEEDFLSEVKAAGGRILSYKWKLEGFDEILEAKVKGVFPEQFTCVNMTTVNYEKEVPVIQVSGRRKTYFSQTENAVPAKSEFYQKLRKVLSVNGSVIKEEKLNPYNICFSCHKNSMQNAVSALVSCFKEFENNVSSIEIREVSENSFEITAGELNAEVEGRAFILSLEMLAENMDLFGETKKVPVPVKQSIEKKSQIKNELKEKSGALKIGEIKSSDGKVISFYKNSDGKIVKILEETRK